MAMTNVSAGLLVYRRRGQALEVFLAHPGGPYWRRKNEGVWQLPKGGALPGETLCNAALREFEEEIGTRPPGEPWPLIRIRQMGGKWVEVFAIEADLDPADLVSNRFEIEWPPRSGTTESFPEVDRAVWLPLEEAQAMILPSQVPCLAALAESLRKSRII